ncbi:MAG: hypothetical protein K0Q55_784 [Verrucomicrobia bacterium]|jgi:hypothetical protein|nr:hypothetical protein [Verrucomicrobiota bacterium]
MDDEKYYQAVADELREGRINDGLWTKALARCQGDENKTKATYIQWRVEQIMQAEKKVAYPGVGAAEESEEITPPAAAHPALTVIKWIAVVILIGVIFWAVKFLLWPKLQTYL